MTQPVCSATWRLIPTVIEHLRKNPKDADAWEIKELCERAQAATVAPLTVPDEEVIQSILSVVAYDMHDAVEKDLRALLARKSIPSAIPKPSKILTAEINDGVLSVSIGLDTLAFALQAGPRWPQDVEIMDAATFGKDVLRALEHEEEDGTTLVHRIFDRAGMEAMEQGSEGCRERS